MKSGYLVDEVCVLLFEHIPTSLPFTLLIYIYFLNITSEQRDFYCVTIEPSMMMGLSCNSNYFILKY